MKAEEAFCINRRYKEAFCKEKTPLFALKPTNKYAIRGSIYVI